MKSILLVIIALAVLPVSGIADTCSNGDVLCGPSALLAVCRSLNVESEVGELTRLVKLHELYGCTIQDMMDAIRSKGLHVVLVKISPEELLSSQMDSIVYIAGGHFVYIKPGMKDNKIVECSSVDSENV